VRHKVLRGQVRNAFKVLIGKPEGKRPLVTPGCIGEDNIKMDHREYVEELWARFVWLRRETSGLQVIICAHLMRHFCL
jgi:hypothetical protein